MFDRYSDLSVTRHYYAALLLIDATQIWRPKRSARNHDTKVPPLPFPPSSLTPPTGYDGAPADCWALGCILSTLLNGYHPFETHLEESQIESVPESLFGESAMGMIEQDEKITCYNVRFFLSSFVREELMGK